MERVLANPKTVATSQDDLWAAMPNGLARALLLSGLRAFHERGYHATTTRDITALAGVSPGALYVHFRSKEELLYAIVRTGHEEALRVVNASLEGPAPPDVALRRLVRSFVIFHALHHEVAHVGQAELRALTPEHLAVVAALRRRMKNAIRDAIRRGVTAGLFAVHDVPGAALAVVSLCVDDSRWYDPEGPRSPEALGEVLSDLALAMVRAQP